jgi:hypothetical protein
MMMLFIAFTTYWHAGIDQQKSWSFLRLIKNMIIFWIWLICFVWGCIDDMVSGDMWYDKERILKDETGRIGWRDEDKNEI